MSINSDFILGYGAGKASKTSQTIIEETDAWLEENISQETGYVLDRTLAMQNAAAPADLVGDLKSAIGDIEKGYTVFGLVPNTYITGSGVEAYYAGWTSSDYIPTTDDTITVVATVESTYNSFYDENKSFISGKNFKVEVGTTVIQVPSNAKYFRLSNTSAAMANEKVYSTVSVRLGSLESAIKNKDAEAKQNYYENQTLISGRVYDGVYSDAITTIHCTDYLPITPGRTYAIYGGFISAQYSNYYDKNKVYKGSLPLDNLINAYPYANSYNCLIFTAPSNASYVRLNYFNSDLIDGDTLRPEWYFRDITGKKLANKRVLVIGDSISTDVYGNYKKWVSNLLDNGVLSRGYTKNESQHATGYVATYASQANTTFLARLTALGSLAGYDLIITFGGINDWIQSADFDTFKTAVDTYYSYLIENATQARIAVLTPLHTSLYGTNNSAGKTQKDYDDYIKSVANEYAFPCLNLTDESGFCPDKSTTFSDMWTIVPSGYSEHDGVHPNADWEKKYLAPQIEQFLMGLVS